MICCENVSVSYGKATVLKNVSFVAKTGQITVILGKNGSGKTTLLRTIGGTVTYKGSIKIDDLENRSLSVGERAKKIAIMPQLMHSPRITVRDLIAFGRQPYTGITGILSKEDCQIVENVIVKTGLTELADKKINCISGGERQRAYFAMLLAQNTSNLLLDEPSSHMDASYTKNLMSFLKEEKELGKTVVAVLHDLNCALGIADKIVLLNSGNTLFEGNREDFYQSTYAEDIFGLKKYKCLDADCEEDKVIYL